MVRNRNRNRSARPGQQRRRGRGGRFSLLELQARRDTIIGGGYVNNAGVQTANASWGGSSVTLAAGSQIAYQAVLIPQAVTGSNAPPSVGECQVDQIEGSLFLTTPSVNGLYYIGYGIYISKFDTRTGTWGIRLITSAGADAARDDWLLLKAMKMALPVNTAVTDPMLIELKLALPHPVVLGGGEALHVMVNNDTNSAGTIDCLAYLRTRISDVT